MLPWKTLASASHVVGLQCQHCRLGEVLEIQEKDKRATTDAAICTWRDLLCYAVLPLVDLVLQEMSPSTASAFVADPCSVVEMEVDQLFLKPILLSKTVASCFCTSSNDLASFDAMSQATPAKVETIRQ